MKAKIEDILREKYDEVEVPEDLFDLETLLKDVEPLKKKNNIPKYVISILCVVIISCGIAFLVVRNNDRKDNIDESVVQQAVNNTENNVDLPEYVGTIVSFKKKYTINKRNIIGVFVININDILKYDIYDDGKSKYPITKVKAEVLDDFNGNAEKEIEFWIPGGVVSVSKIKEMNLPYDENEIEKFNDNDNVMVNYYEFFPISLPEVGKTYLTTLYEREGEKYVNKDLEYGFIEFDNEEEKVKSDDGSWKEIDLDRYVQELLKK